MDDAAILGLLREDPSRPYTLPEIAKRLGLPEEGTKTLRRTLKGLVKRGEIERERGRAFRLSRAGQSATGRIAFDEQGAAWFEPDEAGQRPVRLVPDEAGRVEDDDRVRVEIIPGRGRRGRIEARLLEVLERPKREELAVFRHIGKVVFVELEPDRKTRRARARRERPVEVLVPPGSTGGAVDGQLVKVEIIRKGRGRAASAEAHVIEVLGKPGDREAEMRRLMIEHQLSLEFPREVEEQALSYGRTPSEEDMRGRRDLRDLPLVTIDSETAKDFDDAVAVVRHGSEGYTLYVAIADVAHYVRPRTPLDVEAFERGTSTYLTDRAIPMLPEPLSNGLCSLMPHVDRLCMVVELTLDRSGHIERTDFYEAVMRSHARLTYTRVAKALEGEPDEEISRLLPTILLLAKVAALFLERRLKRGAIDLDLAEPYVVYDENKFPVDVKKRERNDAHRLIEDLMLAANEAVASYFVDRELPTLFRSHEDPDPDRLAVFLSLCEHLGIPMKLKRHPKPGDVARLLEKLSEHSIGKSLNPLLLRSLMQARYDAASKGHFGLAAERYLHFTSPIRRYPDLIVHRLLKRALRGEELGYTKDRLQEIADHCSEAERAAMMAERESMDLDRAYVALEHLGEPFTATITAAQAFGLFVACPSPFIEGLIPVQSLGPDEWELDEFGATLVGASSGRTFMMGQQVEVEIVSVNIGRRQVELKLVGVEPTPRAWTEERARKRRDEGGDRGPRARGRDDERRRGPAPAREGSGFGARRRDVSSTRDGGPKRSGGGGKSKSGAPSGGKKKGSSAGPGKKGGPQKSRRK